MRVILISTYELGRQPFGLASPAAWLKELDASVTCLDLAVEPLPKAAVASADLVAFYLPMHTATRITSQLIPQVRQLNPRAHLCCYGLYAPVNERFLRTLGVGTVLGGEFEEGLAALVGRVAAGKRNAEVQPEPAISLQRQRFRVPDRSGLPELSKYAHLHLGEGVERTVGYTEASRGCKHLCRHCPVVPVYGGVFRVVERDVVLEDIRRQVARGASHITFGDPDFFNGPAHALAIVRRLHEEFPALTYDVTIKIEHLLKHARDLPVLGGTGCLFVTTAAESFDDEVLRIFDKGHTREDFFRAVRLSREAGLALHPTFVAFTPWTTLAGYADFLETILELGLVENVAPVQYAIRLLIPSGSRLLELPRVQEMLGDFDERALSYPWSNPDPRVDRLQAAVLGRVKAGEAEGRSRRETFQMVWELARAGETARRTLRELAFADLPPRERVPYLTEPWFC